VTGPTPSSTRFHELRVGEIERLTDDAIAITFEVPEELRETYRFVQGQHVAIRCRPAGDDVRRNYSLCSPATSQKLRVAVKRIEDGVFSDYAHTKLAPGDELEVLPPHGRFFTDLDPSQCKRYVAVAAGSGITPILSLISTALEIEPESSFTLLYGNRTSRSIMFLEEIEDLKNRFLERFVVHHVLSRESHGIDLFDGRLDGDRLRRFCTTLLDPAGVDEWFLCGPIEMVEDLRSALAGLGVSSRAVHIELFHTENGTGPTRKSTVAISSGVQGTCSVTIRLEGRESSFEIDPGQDTILDGALRVRADAPYACRGGVCATCRAKLMSGTVEMDHEYALEADEKEAGYVLTCQARPTSNQVAVDFDA
jgi:ring-1,2-phenylacetyl-CoA epoxidase subunit PaaE